VQRGLVGVEVEIGEQGHAAVAGVGGQPLGHGHRDGRRTGPGRAGDRHERGPPSVRRAGGDDGDLVAAADPDAVGVEGVEEGDPIEVGREHRVGTQGGPVVTGPGTADHEHRAPGVSGRIEQIAIDARQPAVDEHGRERPARAEPGS
jgi:hypothetical protein